MTTYFPGILSNGALVPGLAAGTVRTTLGLGTADSPTFAGGTFAGAVTSHTFNMTGASGGGYRIAGSAVLATGFGQRYLVTTGSQFTLGTSTNFNASSGLTGSTSVLYFNASNANRAAIGTNGSGCIIQSLSGITEVSHQTNAQKFRVAKTWTSATSFEQFEIDTTAAGFYDIVAARGSAGGAERGIRIGRKQDGGSFVPWVSFATTGAATFAGNVGMGTAPTSRPLSVGGTGLFVTSVIDIGPGAVRGLTASGEAFIIRNTRSNVGSKNTYVAVEHEFRNRANSAAGPISASAATFTGQLSLRASTTAADTAPIKLPTGVLQTTPQAGAIEYDGTNLHFTDSGGTRRTLAVV